MSAIFISYRRGNAAGNAGRLYDTLTAHFGDDRVFMDVDSIAPGQDFADVLNKTLLRCRAVVVVIDPAWLTVTDRNGNPRLSDPHDYVRIEIEHALAARAHVFPILVDGATMPNSGELPASIGALAGRQAIEVSSTRYRYDAGRLVAALDAALDEDGESSPARSWRAFTRLIRKASSSGARHGRRRRWLLVVGVVLALTAVFLPWTIRALGTSKWESLAPAPTALEGASVAAFDGRLWVAGGVSADAGRTLLDAVNVYDPATDSWRPGPRLPQAVAFAPLVAANDRLYLLGGQAQQGAVKTVFRLDAGSQHWVEDVPLPAGREAGAAAWDGSRLVYAGGVGADHGVSDAVYALVDGRWRQLGKLQVGREKAAAASDGFGTVWILGGRNRNSGVPAYGAVDVIQVDHLSAGKPISPVHSAAAVWISGAGLCVLGGDTGNGISSAVQCVNGYRGIPPLPQPRAGLAAAAIGTNAYTVGGYDAGTHGSAVLSVFRLPPSASALRGLPGG